MSKQWIERLAILGCALLALAFGQSRTSAQELAAQADHQQSRVVTLEGPAIHILVTEPLSRRDHRAVSAAAPAGALSGGNQQKLLLGRALIAQSRLWVLDEPTRGIDIAAKVDIYELIGRMAAEGKAILIISSELPELFGITDRAGLLM